MRDRDGDGQDRGRWGRDDDNNDDERGLSDEERRWRAQSGGMRGGQRFPEPSYGSRGTAQSGGYGQRESNDRGDFGGYGGGGSGGRGYGGETYRGGRYGGGAQRSYGQEQDVNREWSPGGDVRRRDPSSFNSGQSSGNFGNFGDHGRDENRAYYGQRMDRPSERNYGVGYSGYGNEQNRGDEDRGLLERAGDWLQRKLGKAPKGYQRSDERIREDLCDLIMRRGDIDASDVTVVVAGGEVTLSGTVRDRHTKRRLEDLSDEVLGVNDVHNEVKVRREGETSAATGNVASTASATSATSLGNDVNGGARTTPGGNDKSNRA